MASAIGAITERRDRLAREEDKLAETVCRLEERKSRVRRGSKWSDDCAPEASATSASPCQVRFTIQAPRESCIEYLWVKKVGEGGEGRKVAVVQAVKPGQYPILSAELPEGEYIAMAFSSKNGLWKGSPFKIGYDRIEL